MTKNFWTEHASELADAYCRSAGTVRFELVTRALLKHLPPAPQRIVDVGGGFGRQAIMLARAGHSVVIVDPDPNMLAIARDALSIETAEVVQRVMLVSGDGETAEKLVGKDFDLACCHSVLMYQDDPVPLLRSVTALVRKNGLVSVLCVNKESAAMRTGLQGNWREAIATLETGTQRDSRYLPSRELRRAEVIDILQAAGAVTRAWYGIGVFTDHLTDKIVVDDPEEVYHAEYLAGSQDPYRQVARCFHIVAERTS
jgi:S-adenosylmethionine-dependent methyltransferase